jgi:hypothetical protein
MNAGLQALPDSVLPQYPPVRLARTHYVQAAAAIRIRYGSAFYFLARSLYHQLKPIGQVTSGGATTSAWPVRTFSSWVTVFGPLNLVRRAK